MQPSTRMTLNDPPLSSSFDPSSWSSSFGVSEAFASYQRSQYIMTGQVIASPAGADEETLSAECSLEDFDEEAAAIVGSPEWDEEISAGYCTPRPQPTVAQVQGRLSSWSAAGTDLSLATDQTPLLRPTTSQPIAYSRGIYPEDQTKQLDQHVQYTNDGPSSCTYQGQNAPLRKRVSLASTRSEKQPGAGTSTFGQTLFNSTAILLGFGLLAEPLAFAYAGWVGAAALLISFSLVTCYTAKILAHIMLEDPQMRTYADIAIKAFGKRSRFVTSPLFCLELFSVCVILVTLFGDSFHSVWPAYSATAYKLIALAILLNLNYNESLSFIPSSFCPLSVLSCGSIIGILSTLLIVTVLFMDGIAKPDAPGSLWSPAETNLGFRSWKELGAAFGLFMAGFSGHVVLPSLAKDMSDPSQFDVMINWAFVAATVIYALVGACGYLMFGNNVSDEFSREMLSSPGYNALLNKIAVWSLVIMPITKLALSARPVNIALEIALGLDKGVSQDQTGNLDTTEVYPTGHTRRFQTPQDLLIFAERALFACFVVTISITIPQFSQMMAFLGSFNAFMLCVIGPISAKIALEGKCDWIDGFLVVSGIAMAIWGTGVAFLVS